MSNQIIEGGGPILKNYEHYFSGKFGYSNEQFVLAQFLFNRCMEFSKTSLAFRIQYVDVDVKLLFNALVSLGILQISIPFLPPPLYKPGLLQSYMDKIKSYGVRVIWMFMIPPLMALTLCEARE